MPVATTVTRTTTTTTTVSHALPFQLASPYAFASVKYNKWYARLFMAWKYHWTSTTQFRCLNKVWTRESHWNEKAHNHRSGAYGIPQALPGRKMGKAGAHWRTDPRTQIKWGLRYISRRYHNPCGAYRHITRHGWY